MNNYLLLAACVLLGMLLRRSRRLPDNAAASLNGFVIHISLPAMTLTYVHGLKLDTTLILPALMAWVMFGIGCGFFWLAARQLGFSRATTGGLMLTGGLANTSFLGLPMIETFYGPQFLGLGILIDQLGSYFVLSTLGIMVASLYSSGESINTKKVIRKIVLFAPFQASVAFQARIGIRLGPVRAHVGQSAEAGSFAKADNKVGGRLFDHHGCELTLGCSRCVVGRTYWQGARNQ